MQKRLLNFGGLLLWLDSVVRVSGAPPLLACNDTVRSSSTDCVLVVIVTLLPVQF